MQRNCLFSTFDTQIGPKWPFSFYTNPIINITKYVADVINQKRSINQSLIETRPTIAIFSK